MSNADQIAGIDAPKTVEFDNTAAYHASIKKLFDQKSDFVFPNSNKEHAASILIEIFRHAQKEVLVFCHNLSSAVWNGNMLVDAIFRAYVNRVNIRIAVQSASAESQALIDLFYFLRIPVRFNCHPKCKGNFVVADERMYRVEEDYSKFRAFACANDPECGKILADLFRKIVPPEWLNA